MANMGAKYQGFFGAANGKRHRYRILEDGYSGGVTLLQFAGQTAEEGFLHFTDQPCFVEWGRDQADPYAPVLGSHSEAEFWKIGGTTLLQDLAGAKNDKFHVHIDCEAVAESGTFDEAVWRGRVISDNYQDSTMRTPARMTVEAVDGLGLLEDIPYADTDEETGDYVQRTGRVSKAALLSEILSETGLGLGFTIALDILPASMAGSGGGAAASLEVDRERFWDREDDEPINCKAILKALLYSMGARLFQQGGKWHIVSRSIMGDDPESSYTAYTFDSSGNATGTETVSGPEVLDLAETARLQGGRTFRSAVSKCSLLFAHGNIPLLIEEPGFGEGLSVEELQKDQAVASYDGAWNLESARSDPPDRHDGVSAQIHTTTPAYKHREGLGWGVNPEYSPNRAAKLWSFFHGSLTDPEDVRREVVSEGASVWQQGSRSIDAGDIVAFSGRFLIEHNEGRGNGVFNCYWRVRVGDYWLQDDGSWEKDVLWAGEVRSQVHVQYAIEPGEEYHDIGARLEHEYTRTWVSEPHPEGGEAFIQLWGTSDTDGQDLDPGWTRWDEIYVSIVDEEGEARTGTRFTARVEGLAEPARDEITTLVGDGPVDFQMARITNAAGERMTDWSRAGTSYTGRLEHVLTETWLRSMMHLLEERQETYQLLQHDLRRTIQMESDGETKTFAAVKLRRDLYRQHDEVTLVQWKYDEATEIVRNDKGSREGMGAAIPRGGRGTWTPEEESVLTGELEAAGGGTRIYQGTALIPGTVDSVTVYPQLDDDEDISVIEPHHVQLSPLSHVEEYWRATFNGNRTFNIELSEAAATSRRFAWWLAFAEVVIADDIYMLKTFQQLGRVEGVDADFELLHDYGSNFYEDLVVDVQNGRLLFWGYVAAGQADNGLWSLPLGQSGLGTQLANENSRGAHLHWDPGTERIYVAVTGGDILSFSAGGGDRQVAWEHPETNGTVESFAVDHVAGEAYVAYDPTGENPRIERYSLPGFTLIDTILTAGEGTNLEGMAYDPRESALFYAHGTTIFRRDSDGTTTALYSASSAVHNFGLDAKNARIYWRDAETSTVRRMNYDGSQEAEAFGSEILDVASAAPPTAYT